MVRMKKKKEVLDKNQELASTWRHCALSHNPLRVPVVACEKGRLFNKEAILEHLIDKGENEIVSHVRSLKDVKELTLTPNPAYKDYDKEALIGGESIDYGNAMFSCPVIGLEMNGRWRFIFLWRCGCVFSEKALQELKTDKCHKCGKGFEAEDVIVINGNQPEDAAKMESNMVARREKAKLEKKNKKKRKLEGGEGSKAEEEGEGSKEKKKNDPDDPVEAGIAAALKQFRHTAEGKDEAEGKVEEKRDLPSSDKNRDKTDTKRDKTDKGKDAKGGHGKKSSVQSDPSKSEVYKSLFTSHKDAANQPKAHWVTMNPGYFR